MPYVASCTFREPTKTYYLDPCDLEIHAGDYILAQTDRGLEMGSVKWLPREIGDDKIAGTPQRIERVATAEDLLQHERNREFEAEAMRLIREQIQAFGLPMKPVSAEVTHDGSKLYFYYESEDRVDFRELLRELTQRLGLRLHLQQVSPREAAGIIGGVGICGRELCCATWLDEKPPVTLKMAKEQGMALTPSKISGSCGRLMCCLRYEVDFYRDQNMRLPRPGSPVDSPEGPGHVLNVNVLSEQCVVELGDGRRIVVPGEDLRALRESRGTPKACNNHVSAGGSCEGAAGGGCSSKSGKGCGSGGCGSGGCGSGGCGSKSKKSSKTLVTS
jgi:cell fate regulator YaaT (PSP1 superfamily)